MGIVTNVRSDVAKKPPVNAHRIWGLNVLSGAASLSGAQFVRRGFRTIFLLLAARVLGPETLGAYVLLLTVIEILALISGAGFGDYLTREIARSPGSAYQLFFRITQLRLTYLVILLPITIGCLHLLRYSPAVLLNAGLLSLTLAPRALAESSQGVMRAMQRFGSVFWVELLQGAVLLGAGTFLLLRGGGLRGAIWSELASISMGAAAALPIALRQSPERVLNAFNWKQRIRETYAFNLYPLIVSTYDRVDVVLLSKLMGNTAVGIYSLPYRAFAALSIVPSGIMGTLLPSLAKSKWKDDERERGQVTLQLLYAMALFLILAAMLVADFAVRFLLGPRYQGSVVVLKILAWATIPVFLNNALNTFLLALKRERVFLRTASICTAVNVAANLLLIPHYSYIAAAGVTILTEVVLFGQNLLLVRKSLGYMPLPRGAVWNTLGFLAMLAVAHQAMRFLPAVGVAAATLVAFLAYLHITRSLPWSPREESAVFAG